MPNSAEAEYFIGRIAFARGRTPDALTHFDRARRRSDGTRARVPPVRCARVARRWAISGVRWKSRGRDQSRPDLGDSYWVRAIVRLRMGAVKDALLDLTRRLCLTRATEAYAVQGDCYEQLRKLPEAIAAYRTALDGDPARGEWWYRLGRCCSADFGNRGDADAESSARSSRRQDRSVAVLAAGAYRLAGENAEASTTRGAIRLYKRYVEIAPTAAIDRSEIEKTARVGAAS